MSIKPWKDMEEPSVHVANLKKSAWKGNIFYILQLRDILKKAKSWRRYKDQWLSGVLVARAVGNNGEEHVEFREFLGEWTILHDTIMVGTWCHAFAKIHRTVNTSREP